MKERPILFSAPMIRAFLAGTKTQTRRALRGFCPPSTPEFDSETGRLEWLNRDEVVCGMPCPYGQPGDRLWVREAWARTKVFPGSDMVVYRESDNRTDYGGPWKPGIHMFRRDSRITLEITDIRVERLQDISEADALSEGIVKLPDDGFGLPAGEHYHAADPRISYWSLWDAINGQGATEVNPWVWVASFKRAAP
jgi:hypothetical protein